jgi:hypothetical protein
MSTKQKIPAPWGVAQRRIREDLKLENDAKLQSAATDMFRALRQVQDLVNGSRFFDENERLKVWSIVDGALRKVK